jgi:glycosyltransferase involved in cell wall biosynthesis
VKISMCIPVLIKPDDIKRLDMLVDCLLSILKQSHTDYEVILKDALPQTPVTLNKRVAETINAFGSQINYVACADKNIHDGLNQALWWATGDILHYICGDDEAGVTDTLAFINDQFESCDMFKPAWLYGSTQCILEDGSEGPWGIQPWATLEETLIHNRMGCGATFWNRAMFSRIGYWDVRYRHAADYDYWCRCYRITPPLYTTRAICQVRNWSGSISRPNVELLESEASAIAIDNAAAHARNEEPIYVPFSE